MKEEGDTRRKKRMFPQAPSSIPKSTLKVGALALSINLRGSPRCSLSRWSSTVRGALNTGI
ncbi:hypothetical protein LR48_Vigan03g072200 [Vigna angularis]|uniref:Uncharacterized protein n=1 Tax=Phaseolus angularis TaxID=3914 RepID=A0A0L9U3I1_PHAAN|nr:hypothetical protein LR48_Vigan03g072200 [Vigna angularis]